jgi:hypothetical protein
MENVKQLRDELILTYENLKAGKMGIREAKEYANVCGKIMSSAKLELMYNVYVKSGNKIPFLEVSNEQP